MHVLKSRASQDYLSRRFLAMQRLRINTAVLRNGSKGKKRYKCQLRYQYVVGIHQ